MIAPALNVNSKGRQIVFRQFASFAILGLTACASRPSQAPSAVSPAPASPAAVTATSASAAAPLDANAKQHADVVKRALKAGYQVAKLSDGTKRYCTEHTPLGTRFAQRECYTADQLVEVFARQDLYQDQMHQMGACGNAGCGGSN
jgi:hypothetical protein